jgi:hypothetical protein
VTLKIVGCLSMSTIRKRCVSIPEICVHVHMSDNRETMSEAENSWVPVDVDNKEILCDDKRGLCAISRER